ncbi:serine protease inhibitor A6 [Bombina bombina]|uniref:serine protease inhibitor A6 n=1 Tax=Bombina bombina TaxID=8345 RepID=UPI00235A9B39|nr:serine protease inhibitor A6 [Bombina bombina]
MKVLLNLSLLITLVLASDHDASHEVKKDHKDDHEVEQIKKSVEQIAPANMEFSIDLYKHVASSLEKSSPSNIFFSPLSISTAFAMLSLGAKSKTHKQILESLKLNQTTISEEEIYKAFGHLIRTLNKNKSHLKVNIGNAVFVQESLNLVKSFVDDLKHHYNAELRVSDFTKPKIAEQQINDYVKNKTEGKIDQLLKDLDPNTQLVLLNYILFKGEWVHTFNPESTHLGNFIVDDNTTVHVPMMSRSGRYKIFQDEEHSCVVVQLPYKDNAYMLLVIPQLGKIHDIEKALSVEKITKWTNSTVYRTMRLYLPKFSISASLNLNDILSGMGMKNVFSASADLSGITEGGGLKVSKAIHKAVLDVNEKGTEAAAATAIEMTRLASFESERVDRPFLLLICNQDTNSILFMGRVVDPTEK